MDISFPGTIHSPPTPSCSLSLFSKTHLANPSPSQNISHCRRKKQKGSFCRVSYPSPVSCLLGAPSSAFVLPKSPRETDKVRDNDMPKIDKSGRFCSPRAARELALMIIYSSCLEGTNPVRVFENRVNASREAGYQFQQKSLMDYNHMRFGGPPVATDSFEEAKELQLHDEKESAIEAEVLLAPPKLVYSKLVLRFTRKLLVAVVEKWGTHVVAINKIAPPIWKKPDRKKCSSFGGYPRKNIDLGHYQLNVQPSPNEPAGRILEFSILHMAMSEITVLGTGHPIVINEAVVLAKRFCDGGAPRIINGCLRTFMKDLSETQARGSR